MPFSCVQFLPLGADINTAVYRAVTEAGTAYFVKLRRDEWLEANVLVPAFLHDRSVEGVIVPVETTDGELWTQLNEFAVIVHPFVTGQDGFSHRLADHHWVTLGRTLRWLHALELPADLQDAIPWETWSGEWRDRVRSFQAIVDERTFDDPSAAALARIMREQRAIITTLVEGAEQLGGLLRERSLERVLCHADLHAWNLLIDGSDTLHIVDWDTLRIAPKECDLMFIGSGIGNWDDPRHESLFYQRYGETEIDIDTIAYYRCERVVQDIAAFAEQLLLSDEGATIAPRPCGTSAVSSSRVVSLRLH